MSQQNKVTETIKNETLSDSITEAKLENRGRGFVASRGIAFGEILLQEQAYETIWGVKAQDYLEALPKLTKAVYTTLSDASDPMHQKIFKMYAGNPILNRQTFVVEYPETPMPVFMKTEKQISSSSLTTSSDLMSRAHGICWYNSFSLENECFPGISLFPVAATFNHSCFPNAHFVFDVKKQNDKSHAAFVNVQSKRAILCGEEVCISYIDLSNSQINNDTKERQKALSPFGFQCNCPRCVPLTQL